MSWQRSRTIAFGGEGMPTGRGEAHSSASFNSAIFSQLIFFGRNFWCYILPFIIFIFLKGKTLLRFPHQFGLSPNLLICLS